MNLEETKFIAELYSKVSDLDEYIKDSGFQERVMSVVLIGLIDEIKEDPLGLEAEEDDMVEMKTMFMYNLEDREELDTVINVMEQTFNDNDSLSGLLNGTGISLN